MSIVERNPPIFQFLKGFVVVEFWNGFVYVELIEVRHDDDVDEKKQLRR